MPLTHEHPNPTTSDHTPATPDAVLHIHRNDLKPEVRAYADNLRDQIRKIFSDYGVKTVDEFSAAARTKKISREKVREVQLLLHQLRTVIETGTIPIETLEREHLKQERRKQAQTLFDKGWGKELHYTTLTDYLATIPEAPPQPEHWKGRFDRLVLVDDRIPLTKACQLAGLTFNGDDRTFIPFDQTKEKTGVRWMYANDGRQNNGKKVADCRAAFPADEVGLNTMEGVSLYVVDPTVINERFLDLPSSVDADNRAHCAFLGRIDNEPRLRWSWDDLANPLYGSASRGE